MGLVVAVMCGVIPKIKLKISEDGEDERCFKLNPQNGGVAMIIVDNHKDFGGINV